MKTLFQRALGSAMLLTSLVQVACGSPNEPVEAGPPTAAELRIVTPSAREVLPEEARAAIIEAATSRSGLTGPITLINLRWEGTWALGTLTVADLDKPMPEGEHSHLSLDAMYSVILVHTERGWEAALEGDSLAAALLERVPLSGLEASAREAMFLKKAGPAEQAVQAQAYSGYKFFWPANVDFRTTQGWHDNYTWGNRYPAGTSLDFAIAGGGNSDILAGAPGVVSHICNDGTQALVGITTSGTTERLGYLHIDTPSMNAAGIYQGMTVSTGTKLGRMLYSTPSPGVETACGYSYGTHVHMYLPYKNITIDGKAFSSSNVHWGVSLWSSQGTSTPPGGEIIVDNTSAGFTKYGPSAYWYSASIGYGGSMWYTYANGTVKSNYAQWRPTLSGAGNYTVYVFVPNNYATSQQAPYRIYHNGVNNYATVNQNIYYDQWVSLGTFYFSGNGTEYVEVSDASGEAANSYRMIGVDAVKFVK